MKRALITISLLMMLAFGLLTLMPIQLSGRAQSTGLLTPSEIAAAWPNLPTAKELYDTGSCLMIDLRYAGKQSIMANGLPGGLPDPNSPTVYDPSSLIANCTSNDPIIELGIVVQNDPHIWLQYNSSVWVEVPASYLQTSVEPYATAVQQILNAHLPNVSASPSPDQAESYTWAVGEYDNPSDITGSNVTTGAISYGEWTNNTLGSGSALEYTGVDVLSIETTTTPYNYLPQNVMALNQSERFLSINIWDMTYPPNLAYANNFIPWSSGSPPSLNTMYNLYMKKLGSAWYFCWNSSIFYLWGDPGGTGTSILTNGNQTNAGVESNDFTQTDWIGFRTLIGNEAYFNGAYHCLPAIGFYFNNNWYPSNVGDPCPTAYEYNASGNPGLFGIGLVEPPVWVVGGTTYTIGEGWPTNKEEFGVLYTSMHSFFTQQGEQIWSQGPWP